MMMKTAQTFTRVDLMIREPRVTEAMRTAQRPPYLLLEQVIIHQTHCQDR